MSEKKQKLWGSRFASETAPSAERFMSSVRFDKRLWREDIDGSIAHVTMLTDTGVLLPKEMKTLIRALQEIHHEIESEDFQWHDSLEDVHTNIEARLREKIGDLADKLHTARSRNDQVATDFRLWLLRESEDISYRIIKLQQSVLELAEKNYNVLLPGYTHLQHGQPILASHHLLAYLEMLQRDRDRIASCRKRISVLPLGSCAIAGTSIKLNRKKTAELLGFSKVSANSVDAVSDRDFAAELVFAITLIGVHISRLAEELVLWSSHEFGFVKIGDAFTTGSSAMPQKKNPDVAELARGKTGRLIGNLVNILTMLKGLPLAYNRDLQEDKEPVFDAIDTIKDTLAVFSEMLTDVEFSKEKIADSLKDDFSSALDLAEYLVSRGTGFRAAHRLVGSLVSKVQSEDRALSSLCLEELRMALGDADEDILPLLVPEENVKRKTSFGGTAPALVKKSMEDWRKRLFAKKDSKKE
ncbi:MAG: argininosuccinate lyase [Candidatus Theseobacter exili]|nr:argininosuccinate lyase [Candidatus Theseobacter exili]